MTIFINEKLTIEKTMKKALRNTLIITGALMVSVTASFFIYCGIYSHADDWALSFIDGSETVEVTRNGKDYIFTPTTETNTRFIFYPGGKVEDKAYAPLCSKLAQNGIETVLVHVPFNLAFFKIDAAKQYMNDESLHYYLGGHSLGGVAASYFAEGRDDIEGMIYMGSYSPVDLSKKTFNTLAITATNDKVMNWDKYNDGKSLLPNLKEVSIEGGNHCQFGSYGKQSGDGEATISKEEQTEQVVTAITSFINK